MTDSSAFQTVDIQYRGSFDEIRFQIRSFRSSNQQQPASWHSCVVVCLANISSYLPSFIATTATLLVMFKYLLFPLALLVVIHQVAAFTVTSPARAASRLYAEYEKMNGESKINLKVRTHYCSFASFVLFA